MGQALLTHSSIFQSMGTSCGGKDIAADGDRAYYGTVLI